MPYTQVTKENPCPICGKPDWCLASIDGEMAICPRTFDGSIRYIDDAGYLHQVTADMPGLRKYPLVRRPLKPRHTIDAKKIAMEYNARLDAVRLAALASELGVSTASLEELTVGWNESQEAYTFPMRNGASEIIGIRTRHRDGSKRAIAGSRAGLFIPETIRSMAGSIYICEGPTDTAAMLTLGLAAIGRPSCMGSHDQVREFLRRFPNRDVIIVADNDGPGRAGAVKLRESIGAGRIVTPPDNVKDIRERVREAVTEFEIMEDCDAGTH